MSFKKLKVCESTEIAFATLAMFQLKQVNCVLNEYGDNVRLKPESEADGRKGLYNVLDSLSYWLVVGRVTEVRVHDVKTYTAWCETFERLVQFVIDSRGKKVIFSVTVVQKYLDGDKVCGLTRWQTHNVNVTMVESLNGQNIKKEYAFRSLSQRRDGPFFGPAMKKTFGGEVYLHSEVS